MRPEARVGESRDAPSAEHGVPPLGWGHGGPWQGQAGVGGTAVPPPLQNPQHVVVPLSTDADEGPRGPAQLMQTLGLDGLGLLENWEASQQRHKMGPGPSWERGGHWPGLELQRGHACAGAKSLQLCPDSL